ncbi:MAG: lipopolysaccharide biosynthesis protein [Gaiellaceae bacterium]
MLGLADQAVASGSNFFTIILLGRTVSPASFGYFVLAFTLLQSAGAVQSALITRPHNVLGALRQGDDYVRYTTAAAFLQIVYAACWFILLVVCAAGARAAGSPSATLFLLAAPAALAWQLQEFARRVLYTEGRLHIALLDDLLSYGGQIAVLLWLSASGALTGPRALLVVIGTSAVAALAAVPLLHRSIGREIERGDILANWRFGRWLGAAEVAYWLASQSYIYMGGLFVGPVVSATLKAAQTLLGPVSVFLAFFVNYLPTVFARSAAGARGGLSRRMRLGFLSTVPATALYAVPAIVFAPRLLSLVYGEEYHRDAAVVRLFAVYYLVLSISDVFVAALAAQGRTRRIFGGHLVGAAITFAVGWLLLVQWHAPGGAVGMIVSLVGALAVFVRGFRSSPGGVRSHPRDDDSADAATSAKLLPRR